MTHRRRRPSPTTMRPRRCLAVASIFVVVFAGWGMWVSSSFRIPRDAPAAAKRSAMSAMSAGIAMPQRHRRRPSLSLSAVSKTSTSSSMTSASSETSYTMGENDDVASYEETKILSPETVAELIEVSFVQSCLQLSKGYVDVLKLFVVSVKAGYEKSISLSDLNRYVMDCPIKSAGRELVIEEVGLRSEWMGVVYGLLDALGDDGIIDGGGDDGGGGWESSMGVDAGARARIATAIRATLSVRSELRNEETRSGGKMDSSVALSNLTVERALSSMANVATEEEEDDDPVARAFLTNDVRVALVTLRVLEEEEICTRDAAGRKLTVEGDQDVVIDGAGGGGGRLPRPSIPGT